MNVEIAIDFQLQDKKWMRLRLEPNPNGSWDLWDNGIVCDLIANSPTWPDIEWIRQQAQSYANENPEWI